MEENTFSYGKMLPTFDDGNIQTAQDLIVKLMTSPNTLNISSKVAYLLLEDGCRPLRKLCNLGLKSGQYKNILAWFDSCVTSIEAITYLLQNRPQDIYHLMTIFSQGIISPDVDIKESSLKVMSVIAQRMTHFEHHSLIYEWFIHSNILIDILSAVDHMNNRLRKMAFVFINDCVSNNFLEFIANDFKSQSNSINTYLKDTHHIISVLECVPGHVEAFYDQEAFEYLLELAVIHAAPSVSETDVRLSAINLILRLFTTFYKQIKNNPQLLDHITRSITLCLSNKEADQHPAMNNNNEIMEEISKKKSSNYLLRTMCLASTMAAISELFIRSAVALPPFFKAVVETISLLGIDDILGQEDSSHKRMTNGRNTGGGRQETGDARSPVTSLASASEDFMFNETALSSLPYNPYQEDRHCEKALRYAAISQLSYFILHTPGSPVRVIVDYFCRVYREIIDDEKSCEVIVCDQQLLSTLAKHPRLNTKSGLILCDTIALHCLNDFTTSRVSILPLLLIIKRGSFNPLIREWLDRFLESVCTKIFDHTRKMEQKNNSSFHPYLHSLADQKNPPTNENALQESLDEDTIKGLLMAEVVFKLSKLGEHAGETPMRFTEDTTEEKLPPLDEQVRRKVSRLLVADLQKTQAKDVNPFLKPILVSWPEEYSAVKFALRTSKSTPAGEPTNKNTEEKPLAKAANSSRKSSPFGRPSGEQGKVLHRRGSNTLNLKESGSHDNTAVSFRPPRGSNDFFFADAENKVSDVFSSRSHAASKKDHDEQENESRDYSKEKIAENESARLKPPRAQTTEAIRLNIIHSKPTKLKSSTCSSSSKSSLRSSENEPATNDAIVSTAACVDSPIKRPTSTNSNENDEENGITEGITPLFEIVKNVLGNTDQEKSENAKVIALGPCKISRQKGNIIDIISVSDDEEYYFAAFSSFFSALLLTPERAIGNELQTTGLRRIYDVFQLLKFDLRMTPRQFYQIASINLPHLFEFNSATPNAAVSQSINSPKDPAILPEKPELALDDLKKILLQLSLYAYLPQEARPIEMYPLSVPHPVSIGGRCFLAFLNELGGSIADCASNLITRNVFISNAAEHYDNSIESIVKQYALAVCRDVNQMIKEGHDVGTILQQCPPYFEIRSTMCDAMEYAPPKYLNLSEGGNIVATILDDLLHESFGIHYLKQQPAQKKVYYAAVIGWESSLFTGILEGCASKLSNDPVQFTFSSKPLENKGNSMRRVGDRSRVAVTASRQKNSNVLVPQETLLDIATKRGPETPKSRRMNRGTNLLSKAKSVSPNKGALPVDRPPVKPRKPSVPPMPKNLRPPVEKKQPEGEKTTKRKIKSIYDNPLVAKERAPSKATFRDLGVSHIPSIGKDGKLVNRIMEEKLEREKEEKRKKAEMERKRLGRAAKLAEQLRVLAEEKKKDQAEKALEIEKRVQLEEKKKAKNIETVRKRYGSTGRNSQYDDPEQKYPGSNKLPPLSNPAANVSSLVLPSNISLSKNPVDPSVLASINMNNARIQKNKKKLMDNLCSSKEVQLVLQAFQSGIKMIMVSSGTVPLHSPDMTLSQYLKLCSNYSLFEDSTFPKSLFKTCTQQHSLLPYRVFAVCDSNTISVTGVSKSLAYAAFHKYHLLDYETPTEEMTAAAVQLLCEELSLGSLSQLRQLIMEKKYIKKTESNECIIASRIADVTSLLEGEATVSPKFTSLTNALSILCQLASKSITVETNKPYWAKVTEAINNASNYSSTEKLIQDIQDPLSIILKQFQIDRTKLTESINLLDENTPVDETSSEKKSTKLASRRSNVQDLNPPPVTLENNENGNDEKDENESQENDVTELRAEETPQAVEQNKSSDEKDVTNAAEDDTDPLVENQTIVDGPKEEDGPTEN